MLVSRCRGVPAHSQTSPNISLWSLSIHLTSKRADRFDGRAARYLIVALRMFSASRALSSEVVRTPLTRNPEMSSSGVCPWIGGSKDMGGSKDIQADQSFRF